MSTLQKPSPKFLTRNRERSDRPVFGPDPNLEITHLGRGSTSGSSSDWFIDKNKSFFAQNIIGQWSLPKTINDYWAGTKLPPAKVRICSPIFLWHAVLKSTTPAFTVALLRSCFLRFQVFLKLKRKSQIFLSSLMTLDQDCRSSSSESWAHLRRGLKTRNRFPTR